MRNKKAVLVVARVTGESLIHHENVTHLEVRREKAAALTFPPLTAVDVSALERGLATARIGGRYASTVARTPVKGMYSVTIFLNADDRTTEKEVLAAVRDVFEIT